MSIAFVIVESPYAGDVPRNEEYARRCIKDCLDRGEAPYASHLLYTQVLDDTDPPQRKLGMEAGFEVVRRSDYTVVYEDYGISGDMEDGIEIAKDAGHEIKRRTIGKNKVSEDEVDQEKKKEIIDQLQDVLDQCMESSNQDGSLVITDVEEDENGLEGTGTIEFDWCTPEPENKQRLFMGY